MKTPAKFSRLVALIGVCCHTWLPAADRDLAVDSRISSVTVYLHGAMIERRAELTLGRGLTAIRFEGLSADLDPQSLGVTGQGAFTILSVQHRLDYLGPDRESAAYRKVEDSLKLSSYSLQQVKNRISVLDDEQSLVLANKSIGGANTGVTAAELARVSEYMTRQLGRIRQQLLDRKLQEDSIQEVVKRLQSQLADLKAQGRRPTATVIVELSADQAGPATIRIRYVTPQASWVPAYDIRSDGTGPVRLAYKAQVSQRTGEAWDKVPLTLSTGNPLLSGSLPDLHPWYLRFLQPLPRLSGVTIRKDKAVAMPGETAMEREAADASAGVEVMENRLSTDFRIRAESTIPSDGKAHAVTVRQDEIAAQYSHAAVPKLDPGAFLVARLTGWQDLGLLPGRAYVYLEGAYTGSSYLDPFATEDTLRFSLGRDPRVVIERTQVKEYSAVKTFGGDRVKTFSYDIEVRNTRKDAVRLTVEDQVPVSQDKEISVKAEELSGGALDAESGKVTWVRELAPGAHAKWRLTYSVRYPKNKTIGGL
jgi:uncharacterized protein (TIGR02231 family)